MEKPSNLRDAKRSWSEYKQSETAKVLIAVSTRGTILYISPPWGGRVSDVEIVRQLDPFMTLLKNEEDDGGFVLADKGFRALAPVLPLQVKKLLVMPAAVKTGKQLTKKQVEESRAKSNLRINVERVIGQLRCFKILKHDFPMSMLHQLDHILPICAGIINLRPSLVK